MTKNEATEICLDYLRNGAEQEFSSTRDMGRYCATVAEAASTLLEIDPDDDLGGRVRRIAPGLWDYDAEGHFVGAVANENGWTP